MYCRCLPLFAKKCVCVRARARLCVCLCVCVYDSAKILLARMVFINTVVLFSCWFVPAALSARLCVRMYGGGGVGWRECVSVCVSHTNFHLLLSFLSQLSFISRKVCTEIRSRTLIPLPRPAPLSLRPGPFSQP